MSPELSDEFITLACVVKTQGRHGEVGVQVHSNIPGRFTPGMKLLALGESEALRRELEIEDLWPHKGLLVLKFAGIDSISDAETLVGCELQVPLDQRAALQEGWTYLSDLIGCTAFDHGREIGRIEAVQFGTGEAPLLVVTGGAGKKFDIPFAEAYLEAVDVSHKQLRMRLPQGMLELDAPLTAEEKQQQRASARKKRNKGN